MEIKRKDSQTVEMQMGPMIDMVFLLLVFFMVTSRPIEQESDISLSLPGTVPQEETVDLPDEQRIVIDGSHQVILNDMIIGASEDVELNELVGTLTRFRETAEANRAEALITIAADDATTHQRIVHVLNACARAEITGVTFADDSMEESF